ncbi:DJ-1/PfpI family protein [Mesonia sp. MT50]|uniref:DJ-1/PfpI family protein n=1 Tax=Mesonia profundi TaxID=3070998 RepID=A0ABU0ZZH4_9FLAO|nr:DJ-1/PfpI family protein [Mesonia profundi]MDQ7916861.1 DJ-1/PfpI family protein [Mesonia profundi]
MKKSTFLVLLLSLSLFYSCDFFISNSSESKDVPKIKESQETQIDTLTTHLKPFKEDLPTIGLLMYNGVLTTEITATADVFTKPTQDGEQLFNVITIAETKTPIVTEEGLKLTPDYTFENCPQLEVLFIPSAYDMYSQVHNPKIVDFIKEKNKETTYTVSNCAGAQLVGASGIAKGKKIVTWIGGGKDLQETYPELKVQNDSLISYVEDGKFLSSNGNLTSYISALNLLTKMTSKEHTKFVESYLYLDQLQDWKQDY